VNTASAERPLPQRVFQRLDDRAFVSGEALAADLSVTRAAVWKAVEQLRELGVTLDAQTSKGYRLAAGVSALAPERIESLLGADLCARIEALRVEWTLESTNTRLLDSLPPAAGMAAVILAEHQTGGRGRRGRSWIAPPGGAICLSLAWQYPDMPADLSALSLIVGEALTAAVGRSPELVKVNRSEAAELLGCPEDSDLVEMATAIKVRSSGMAVLTDGVAGAVGCDGSRVLRARGPGVRGSYPVGSGDAFLGGLVAALDQGADLADGLALGMACGTANALIPGPGRLDRSTAYALAREITLDPV
jgi:biotin operon repressor BirA-like protein